jgi:histidine triad (HIT) family protein
MADCLFCRIVAGEIPSKKVFEDDDVLAFEDIAPQAPVHVLVVPKAHHEDVGAASQDAALVGRVVARAAAIARDKGLTDYRLVTNTGSEAGQSVFHLHFHVLGGRRMTWPPG